MITVPTQSKLIAFFLALLALNTCLANDAITASKDRLAQEHQNALTANKTAFEKAVSKLPPSSVETWREIHADWKTLSTKEAQERAKIASGGSGGFGDLFLSLQIEALAERTKHYEKLAQQFEAAN